MTEFVKRDILFVIINFAQKHFTMLKFYSVVYVSQPITKHLTMNG